MAKWSDNVPTPSAGKRGQQPGIHDGDSWQNCSRINMPSTHEGVTRVNWTAIKVGWREGWGPIRADGCQEARLFRLDGARRLLHSMDKILIFLQGAAACARNRSVARSARAAGSLCPARGRVRVVLQ